MSKPFFIYFGKVVDGKLEISNRSGMNREVKIFEGKDVQIEIREKRKYRSNDQNRYMWGCVYPSVKYGMEAKGFVIQDIEQVHELMKYKFLKSEILNIVTGEVEPCIGSTTKLSTGEMEEYLEQIRAWAAQFLETVIPLPNEQATLI